MHNYNPGLRETLQINTWRSQVHRRQPGPLRTKAKRMGNLDGKVIFITGASSGIGNATTKVLAAHGAAVVIVARREAESLELVEELRSNGADIDYIKTDVTDEDQVRVAGDFSHPSIGRKIPRSGLIRRSTSTLRAFGRASSTNSPTCSKMGAARS